MTCCERCRTTRPNYFQTGSISGFASCTTVRHGCNTASQFTQTLWFWFRVQLSYPRTSIDPARILPQPLHLQQRDQPSGEARSKTLKRSGETRSLKSPAGRPKLCSHVAGSLFPRPWGMNRDHESLLLLKHGLRVANRYFPCLATSSLCYLSQRISDLCCSRARKLDLNTFARPVSAHHFQNSSMPNGV